MDVITEFSIALAEAGIPCHDDIIADGHLHRFKVNGDHNRNGWYVFYPDGAPSGAYGCWKRHISETWSAKNGHEFTEAERAEWKRRMDDAKRQREAEEVRRHAEAAKRASALWEAATPAPDDHVYLRRKGIKAHGLRVHQGSLVVQMCDGAELHSLQFIGADGDKRFLTGGRVSGCYCSIGKPDGALCIAEGFATGASIHEATGYAVAVAFNAGNLLPVARALRAKFPDIRLILCADDDASTEGNPGLTKATEAAKAAGGALAIPSFGTDRPAGATDFNDLAQHRGAEAVRAAIANAQAPGMAEAEDAATGDYGDREWPGPKPIKAALHPVPAFDADTLLPEALRGWIVDEADRMPCPPDFIAAAALVELGSIIGARCAIKPKARDDWLIVPNLWGGIVGPPSAKKSPAISAALKLLGRLIARAIEAHRAEMETFESDQVVFEAKREAIEARIKAAAKDTKKGDLDSLAKELQSHRQQAPQAPILRRYKSNDTTIEKLGELLRENPAGLMVLRDELVGLIASWDKEGREGDRAFFLEAWNGNQSFDTDRIKRGSILIPNLCASIFGGIQPDKLTAYLEQAAHALANDGMLQRLQLLVYPDHRAWEWRDRSPNRQAHDRAFAVFKTLADFDPVTWDAAPADDFNKFPHFRFDEGALEVFIEWATDLHRSKLPAEENPIIAQHLAKYDKLFPALALILHLVECAATEQRGLVTKDAALRAAAWCEYLEAHARRCYGLLTDDGVRAAQALTDKVRQGKLSDGFTARDVRRNRWRYLTADDEVQAALDWLEDKDWLRAEEVGGTGPGTGRRTYRYAINPKVVKAGKAGSEHD